MRYELSFRYLDHVMTYYAVRYLCFRAQVRFWLYI
jgi:hypothetical protein